MRVYGLDFTSAPSRRKPITIAVCELRDEVLAVRDLLRLSSFEQLEKSLAQPGPWIAAMDLPLGQPRAAVEALGWPTDWEACARHVGELSREAFGDQLTMFKATRPSGQKEILRTTDKLARALSPMKLAGTPLALMYHAGVPLLARSGACILPCRERRDPRLVVEGYPALVARRLVGHAYKSEGARDTAPRTNARRELVRALRGDELASAYGLRLEIGEFLSGALVDEARADLLDAVLAAVQAGWAFTRRDRGWGVPEGADPLEGWIVDPDTWNAWHDLRSAPAQPR